MVIVPPGVVHAYKNVGIENGLVFNAPDRLYAGEGKKSPVDEVRHEEVEDSPFLLD
jgi:dTDP-4-dehydrorhamnose 3,5-epimerase